MPNVLEALMRIVVDRPSDPLRLLGEHLISQAEKVSRRCSALPLVLQGVNKWHV